MQPANDIEVVRRLADDEERCEFYKPVLEELARCKLDSDDLREIILSELGVKHCYDSKPTRKHYAGTMSDYYSIWINECHAYMFLKLLVAVSETKGEHLVITSFKKDNSYDD